MKLQEQISRIKEMMGISEDYPPNFNMDEFKKLTSFRKRLNYCNKNLQRIGSGSSRAVYKIDEEKVLKLAMNRKGLAQNEHEITMAQYYDIQDIITKMFDCDENTHMWVEMELAKKLTNSDFERIVGFKFNDYVAAIHNYYLDSVKNQNYGFLKIDKDLVQDMWENEFIYQIFNFIGSYEVPSGDLEKLNTYGIVNRDGHETIIIVDYGLNNEILKKFY
jgi:hypothetical protein